MQCRFRLAIANPTFKTSALMLRCEKHAVQPTLNSQDALKFQLNKLRFLFVDFIFCTELKPGQPETKNYKAYCCCKLLSRISQKACHDL